MISSFITVYEVMPRGQLRRIRLDLSDLGGWGVIDNIPDMEPQRIELYYNSGKIIQIAMAPWFFRPIFDNFLAKQREAK